MSWHAQLKGDPLPWLLDAGGPGVRYLALRDLLGGEDILILDSGRQAVIGVACYPVQGPRTLLLRTP